MSSIQVLAYGTLARAFFCLILSLGMCIPAVLQAQCSGPITYSIGSVDSRFGVHFEDFRSSIHAAERMWEYASGKELFQEVKRGEVEINLVYTSRQLRRQIVLKRNTQVHYLNDKIEGFNERARDLEEDVGSYNDRLRQYNQRLDRFNKRASTWNQKQPKNRQLYARLQSEKRYVDRWKQFLEQEALSLTQRQESLLADQEKFQASQKAIKREERKLARLGAYDFKFEKAGEYVQRGKEKSVNIYIYVDQQQLLNVLAHELGHVLGIKHTDKETSIMYSYQTKQNFHLDHVTRVDVAALRSLCN